MKFILALFGATVLATVCTGQSANFKGIFHSLFLLFYTMMKNCSIYSSVYSRVTIGVGAVCGGAGQNYESRFRRVTRPARFCSRFRCHRLSSSKTPPDERSTHTQQ